MTDEENRLAINKKACEIMKLIADANEALTEITEKFQKITKDLEQLWFKVNNDIQG